LVSQVITVYVSNFNPLSSYSILIWLLSNTQLLFGHLIHPDWFVNGISPELHKTQPILTLEYGLFVSIY